MAGLLDGLFGSSGGGILDFLRANAMNQQFSSGLPSDQAQYAPMQQARAMQPQAAPSAQPIPLDTAQWPFGPVGAPSQEAAIPPNAQPAQGQLPVQQPTFGGDSYIDRLNAGGGLIRSLFGGGAKQQQQQQLFEAYKNAGLSPSQAYVAVLNPKLADNFLAGGQAKSPTSLGDGYIWNPDTKKVERAFTPEAKAPTSLGEGYVWNPATKKVERAFTPQSKEDKMGEEIKAREEALKARGIDPKDPKHQQYVLTGKYPREDAQPLSAADKKAIMSAEDDNALLVGTLDTLNRAKDLNNKTFTGWTAGARGWAGTALPGASAVLDPEAAKATREFGQLMSGEAIKSMAETLKGATTDREMARFLEMLADPSTPPDIRERTITRMIQLAERQRKINDSRINDLRGGTYYKPGQGTSAPAAPTNLKEKYGLD
jgi:hypothetical protein